MNAWRTRRRIVSVPFSIWTRPFLQKVLDGVCEYAKQNAQWDLLLPQYFKDTGVTAPGDYIPHIDGQISGVPHKKILQTVLRPQVPTVIVGYTPRPKGTSTVILDYHAVAEKAVTHFSEQGVQHLALFGSLHDLKHDHRDMRQGILSSAQKRNIPCSEFTGGPHTSKSGYSLSNQLEDLVIWLKTLPAQTGIICGDDEYAGCRELCAP